MAVVLDTGVIDTIWGDPEFYQRLLRALERRLQTLDVVENVDALPSDVKDEYGKSLHKVAGKASNLGLNPLAAALRGVHQGILAGKSVSSETDVLKRAVREAQTAIADYRRGSELPFVDVVPPESADKQLIASMLEVFARVPEGGVSTGELDDAMFDLFDAVGEQHAGPVVDALDLLDYDALARACDQIKRTYSLA